MSYQPHEADPQDIAQAEELQLQLDQRLAETGQRITDDLDSVTEQLRRRLVEVRIRIGDAKHEA
jgi:hypothetical protein